MLPPCCDAIEGAVNEIVSADTVARGCVGSVCCGCARGSDSCVSGDLAECGDMIDVDASFVWAIESACEASTGDETVVGFTELAEVGVWAVSIGEDFFEEDSVWKLFERTMGAPFDDDTFFTLLTLFTPKTRAILAVMFIDDEEADEAGCGEMGLVAPFGFGMDRL